MICLGLAVFQHILAGLASSTPRASRATSPISSRVTSVGLTDEDLAHPKFKYLHPIV
jgi:hypothetical protein